MKKYIILFALVVASVFHAVAQNNAATRTTIEQLPYENRADYIKQATNFLHMYYSQLLLNVDELMIREEYIKANMSDNAQRYKPEFMLVSNNNMNFLTPEQYLQELGKQYREYNTDKIEITVDNVNINQDDFFMPNIVKLYVIAEYDLTLSYEDKILFKRRCRAYCLFPKAMVYINVKLMQVEPVRDIVAYVAVENKTETETKVQKTKGQNISFETASQTGSSQSTKNYDYIGKYDDGIAVIRKDNKYGFVKEDGTILVHPIYDAIGCQEDGKAQNDLVLWKSIYKLISVKKDGKWGMIDKDGITIVPFMYDCVEKSSNYDNSPIWVMKDGKHGCVDENGKVIIPVKYEEKIRFYNGQPAKTKLNGKWGCLNEAGEAVVPFIFSYKVDFGWDNKYAPAKKGDKYGYLNRKGEWFIPAKYDYAGAFYHERAAVKLNGKMGFIDTNGNLVIPAIYESAVYLNFSRKEDGDEYNCIGYSFYEGRAEVKQNGKWGLIDVDGKQITPFIYDRFIWSSKYGYSFDINGKYVDCHLSLYNAIEGKDTVYLDFNGNRYMTKKMRYEKCDSIMAEQGLVNAMVYLAEKKYEKKDIKNALKWFNKATESGDIKFYNERAKCYYYAKDDTKSYSKALELFKKAAKENNKEAMSFLGWMYEHGQGCKKNISEAISWYKKADNYGDSKKRLEELDKLYANGYEYVDLGLSVKWATCNLGASVPEESGDRYAWGEFNTKSTFTKKNCTTYKKKYMMNFSGREYWDAARSNRKGLWRTPTAKEFSELIVKCKWDWTEINGKTGYKVTGPNGNSIFIPFGGNYWSSTSTDSKIGTFFGIGRWDKPYISTIERFFGHYIRPVID